VRRREQQQRARQHGAACGNAARVRRAARGRRAGEARVRGSRKEAVGEDRRRAIKCEAGCPPDGRKPRWRGIACCRAMLPQRNRMQQRPSEEKRLCQQMEMVCRPRSQYGLPSGAQARQARLLAGERAAARSNAYVLPQREPAGGKGKEFHEEEQRLAQAVMPAPARRQAARGKDSVGGHAELAKARSQKIRWGASVYVQVGMKEAVREESSKVRGECCE